MNNAMSRKMKQLLIQLAKEAPEFPRMQALTSKYEMDNTQIHKLLDYVKEIGVLRILQVRKEDGGLARFVSLFLGEHESDGKPFPGDGADLLGRNVFRRSDV